MTSIRTIKKEKTRVEILAAAKELFIERGYDEVTMEEIAKVSNVGTGTIYNYYKNKGDIFVASIQESFENDIVSFNSTTNQKIDVIEIILDMIHQLITKYEWMFSRKIMKGFVKAAVSIGSGKDKWLKSMAALDMKYIDHLEETLNHLKENNIFHGHSRYYAELIYSAFAYEILIYVYYDTITMEQVKNNLDEKIKIIFYKGV